MNTINVAGRRFGRLTVLARNGSSGRGHALWLCRCECGEELLARGSGLQEGSTRSCGCLHADWTEQMAGKYLTTHGQSGTKTYESWSGMLARCFNPAAPAFDRYGARGITVCERWRQFDNFFADMGKRPIGKTLDRYPNNDGNYEPSNCRWATYSEQNQNRRSNKIVTFRGRDKCVAAWATELGIAAQTISSRLARQWTVERAFTTPVRVVNHPRFKLRSAA